MARVEAAREEAAATARSKSSSEVVQQWDHKIGASAELSGLMKSKK